jgi:hypothetical protein
VRWGISDDQRAGDYIGAGRIWSHGPPETVRVSGTRELVSFRIDTADGLWWSGDGTSCPRLRGTFAFAAA